MGILFTLGCNKGDVAEEDKKDLQVEDEENGDEENGDEENEGEEEEYEEISDAEEGEEELTVNSYLLAFREYLIEEHNLNLNIEDTERFELWNCKKEGEDNYSWSFLLDNSPEIRDDRLDQKGKPTKYRRKCDAYIFDFFQIRNRKPAYYAHFEEDHCIKEMKKELQSRNQQGYECEENL